MMAATNCIGLFQLLTNLQGAYDVGTRRLSTDQTAIEATSSGCLSSRKCDLCEEIESRVNGQQSIASDSSVKLVLLSVSRDEGSPASS